MKLWAISDVHVGHSHNRRALAEISARPDDWLILGGDVCESARQLEEVLDMMAPKFAQLLWVPGNHELWTTDGEPQRGVEKYQLLVDVCRARGVLTPEDDYPVWRGEGGPHIIAPLFLLYDYTFGPDGLSPEEAKDWAWEENLMCADERLLAFDPYPTREAWCHARVEQSATRLEACVRKERLPTVLINHYPLLESHAVLPLIPRFSIWCGTRRTEDWHLRFDASVVVYGHLHLRTTRYRDATRFEEVSLGYPRQYDGHVDDYVRQILPHPDETL